MKSKVAPRRKPKAPSQAEDVRVVIPSQTAAAIQRRVRIREALHDARGQIVRVRVSR